MLNLLMLHEPFLIKHRTVDTVDPDVGHHSGYTRYNRGTCIASEPSQYCSHSAQATGTVVLCTHPAEPAQPQWGSPTHFHTNANPAVPDYTWRS
jgi:hypothetical protein